MNRMLRPEPRPETGRRALPLRSASVSLPADPTASRAGPQISSDDLFGERNVIEIAHEGMVYTLRITRQGKLLLTK